MSSLGNFLEFSVRTPDVLESLGFYKMLGFTELEIGDVRPHKYAVVSDGVLCIGLHDYEFDSPAVTFVQPDLAKHARSMSDHGFDFNLMHLNEDEFNELGFTDRDGHQLTMVEARTFSRADEFDNDGRTLAIAYARGANGTHALRRRRRTCWPFREHRAQRTIAMLQVSRQRGACQPDRTTWLRAREISGIRGRVCGTKSARGHNAVHVR